MITQTLFQTGISPSAMKKKRSKSGGAKKVTGFLLNEWHDDDDESNILLFFGAGGHVLISGILNLSAFGVEQILLLLLSSISSFDLFNEFVDSLLGDRQGDSIMDDEYLISSFFFFIKGCFFFTCCFFCRVVVVVVEFLPLLVLVLLVLEGPIIRGWWLVKIT